MMTLDVGTHERANRLMGLMQRDKVGYLAVSLGYFKTLFSSPASSTSSEIPEQERERSGISPGLIRFSIGLDEDLELTLSRILRCMDEAGCEPRPRAVTAAG
jgi:methionine-gamma-lyase